MFNFRKNRLFRKIFWLLFFGITFVIVVFGFVGASLQKRAILELLHSEAKSLAQTITFSTTNALITEDSSYLIEFNTQYLQNNTKVKNIIIAKSEKQYFDIKKDLWSFDNKISDVFKKMQKSEDVFDIIYSPNLKENVFHYTYPMEFSGIQWGWLHLSFDLKEYNQKIDSLYKQFFLLFVALVLLSFIISNYVAKKFTDPIIKLNETVYDAHDISAGGTSFSIDESDLEKYPEGEIFTDCMLRLNVYKFEIPQAKIAKTWPVKDTEEKPTGIFKVGIAFIDVPKATEEELFKAINGEARAEEIRKKMKEKKLNS